MNVGREEVRVDQAGPRFLRWLHDETRAPTCRGVTAMAISPDNRWLATGSQEGTARLWPLQVKDLINLARVTVGRSFSADEWRLYFPGEVPQNVCRLTGSVMSNGKSVPWRVAVSQSDSGTQRPISGLPVCELFGVFSEYGPTGRSNGRSPKARP
jgi:hypothetical protein